MLCCVLRLTNVDVLFAVSYCLVLLVRGSRCWCLLLVVVCCLSFIVCVCFFCGGCVLSLFYVLFGVVLGVWVVCRCVFIGLWFAVLYLGWCCLSFVCKFFLVVLRLRVVVLTIV